MPDTELFTYPEILSASLAVLEIEETNLAAQLDSIRKARQDIRLKLAHFEDQQAARRGN